MNVIGWVYGRIQMTMGAAGHTTLGITLMIGEKSYEQKIQTYNIIFNCLRLHGVSRSRLSSANPPTIVRFLLRNLSRL